MAGTTCVCALFLTGMQPLGFELPDTTVMSGVPCPLYISLL